MRIEVRSAYLKGERSIIVVVLPPASRNTYKAAEKVITRALRYLPWVKS